MADCLTETEQDKTEAWLKSQYNPETYLTKAQEKCHIQNIIVGTSTSATVPITVNKTKCNALINTGATRSCMSEDYYHSLLLPKLKDLCNMSVRSASGGNLQPKGFTDCKFTLGEHTFTYSFIVCKNLTRPFILGLDFLRQNRIGSELSKEGNFALDYNKEVLVESIDTKMGGIKLWATRDIHIPGWTILVHNVHTGITNSDTGWIYDLRINLLLQDEFPNIVKMPTVHKVDTINNDKNGIIKAPIIPFVLINLGYVDEYIEKDMILGYLENTTIEVNDGHEAIMKDSLEHELCKKKFITSPADIDTQKRV